MRPLAMCAVIFALVACGGAADDASSASTPTPPPAIPDGAETVAFERNAETDKTDSDRPKYWGVKDGEPLTIMWEDLMPEGSEEELMKAYEDFYAMLEKRYAANTTTLANAADPYAAIPEGSEFDYMPQLGTFDTVEELDGEFVRIPGYVVPFDFKSNLKHKEFLFVPYMGACIHSPPPPPNQLIFVRAEPATRVSDIWTPYWIEGTLASEKTENELGDTAYSLSLSLIEPYEMR